MGKFEGLINKYKEIKQKAENAKIARREANERRARYDTKQFYEDSLQVDNLMTGMAVIVTDNSVMKEYTEGGTTHLGAVRDIFQSLGIKNNLYSVSGDFGNIVANEYHCVFIRAEAASYGPTIVYVPETITPFQLEQLKKYNEEVKEFNLLHKKEDAVMFCYQLGEDEIEKNNLDELIESLGNRKGEFL